ncbi:MAG: hypothetical protein JWP96_209 [Polaromonas sp.]|nr:hypothetical protein [Polaromonas sp.]
MHKRALIRIQPASASLFEAIEALLKAVLGINHKLHAVDPAVHNSHIRYVELLRLLPKDNGYSSAMPATFRRLTTKKRCTCFAA